MKTALVLGGGGFIGGHLAKKLKEDGYWVRVVDIKHKHEFWNNDEICNDYVCGDLRDPSIVSAAFRIERDPNVKEVIYRYSLFKQPFTEIDSFDEVYQLAADMGGAGYIFTGEHDADDLVEVAATPASLPIITLAAPVTASPALAPT